MTTNGYADASGRSPSTLYRWINLRDREPRIPPEFFREVAKITGLSEARVINRLTGEQGGEANVVREREDNGERYAQPLTFRTEALHLIGRLEHYSARIHQLTREHSARIDEICQLADSEITAFRKKVLARIDHDDKGRKV